MDPTPASRRAWSEPPLFEPDWIVLNFRLNIVRSAEGWWGGLEVRDGDTDEVLALTAAPWAPGPAGLLDGVQQLLAVASRHLDPGSPFPA